MEMQNVVIQVVNFSFCRIAEFHNHCPPGLNCIRFVPNYTEQKCLKLERGLFYQKLRGKGPMGLASAIPVEANRRNQEAFSM